MSYIDEVNQKRQSQADKQQLALLMKSAQGTPQRPSIILTDSTDLGSHIAKLGDKIIDVLEAVKDDKSTKQQIDRINDMTGKFSSLVSVVQMAQVNQTDRICAAIESLRKVVDVQKPVIVPAPSVSLQERDVDLKPLLKSLTKLEHLMQPKAPGFSITSYRAQDSEDGRDGMQYIGFMNPDGDWYIMQHDPDNNRDRYYFGADDYDTAWGDKHTHNYYTLGEARRAVSA